MLVIVSLSLFLTIANGTSLDVAAPILQEYLGVPFAHVQWVLECAAGSRNLYAGRRDVRSSQLEHTEAA